jgi:hypothetical protein
LKLSEAVSGQHSAFQPIPLAGEAFELELTTYVWLKAES